MNTLRSLFAHKSWANNELFNALRLMPKQSNAQPHTSALHTAIRTLNHIYVVDSIFKAHLEEAQHSYTTTNTEATPELDELQLAVADADSWFERYVGGLSSADLSKTIAFRFTDGDAGLMSREEILMHVVTHGAYHRGNVGQVLKSISIAPPRDLYTKFLHISQPARRSK
jgi:uncharacterized damage-inducible protein DinB